MTHGQIIAVMADGGVKGCASKLKTTWSESKTTTSRPGVRPRSGGTVWG